MFTDNTWMVGPMKNALEKRIRPISNDRQDERAKSFCNDNNNLLKTINKYTNKIK